jgi:hypothetical protein
MTTLRKAGRTSGRFLITKPALHHFPSWFNENKMSKNPAVVGPFASKCDIVLFVVKNQCIGKTPAVPGTPYLLFVMVEGPEGDVMLTRAAGITEDAQLRFEQQGIHLLKPSASLETMLNTYFSSVGSSSKSSSRSNSATSTTSCRLPT